MSTAKMVNSQQRLCRPGAASRGSRSASSSFPLASRRVASVAAAPGRGRGRGLTTRVLAFRWDRNDPTSETTDESSVKPRRGKDKNAFRNTDFLNADFRAPTPDDAAARAEEAQQAMLREERARDLQRRAMEVVKGAKGWWDKVPDKRLVLLEGAALAVAVYLASAVLSAVDRAPLLPQAFQTVGFGYSAWFWWRYILFASGRTELRTSLARLQARVAESVDELADKTLESHPNAGDGDTGASATARGVVEKLAARHHEAQHAAQHAAQQAQQKREREARAAARVDDGSWLDEPPAVQGADGGEPLQESYVTGLLQELDDRTRTTTTANADTGDTATTETAATTDTSKPTGGGAIDGRSPPIVFALRIDDFAVFARERGADEAEAMDGKLPPSESHQPASAPATASPTAPASAPASAPEAGPFVAGLDPCLGWDTEACAATGHLHLGTPDNRKLEALAEQAARQARAATHFSRRVDESLHAPVNHSSTTGGSGGVEEEDLEGVYGRGAGSMERDLMEEMAKNPNNQAPPSSKSHRKGSLGEETGTGGRM